MLSGVEIIVASVSVTLPCEEYYVELQFKPISIVT